MSKPDPQRQRDLVTLFQYQAPGYTSVDTLLHEALTTALYAFGADQAAVVEYAGGEYRRTAAVARDPSRPMLEPPAGLREALTLTHGDRLFVAAPFQDALDPIDGMIWLNRLATLGPFDEHERSLLDVLAQRTRRSLYGLRAQPPPRLPAALELIVHLATRAPDEATLFRTVVDAVFDALDPDLAAVLLRDGPPTIRRARTADGAVEPALFALRPLFENAAVISAPNAVVDGGFLDVAHPDAGQVRCAIAAPIVIRGVAAGALYCHWARGPWQFARDDVDALLTAADAIAARLEAHRLRAAET